MDQIYVKLQDHEAEVKKLNDRIAELTEELRLTRADDQPSSAKTKTKKVGVA